MNIYNKNVAIFRVDASLDIGTGHVMRCLALAKTFYQYGIYSIFISRNHDGNLIDFISTSGFQVYILPNKKCSLSSYDYESWLGSSQEEDFLDSIACINKYNPMLIIIDHYGLDYVWESAIKKYSCAKLIVIDDLCKRKHCCDVLIDQTISRKEKDYKQYVDRKCKLLIGEKYMFIREEFIRIRNNAYNKRKKFSRIKNVLISMGGIDKFNYTDKIINILCKLPFFEELNIVVVLGKNSPFIEFFLKRHEKNTKFIVGSNNMAELFYNADIAIGSIGVSTWERCVLSLPSINVKIADNQTFASNVLEEIGMMVLDGDTFQLEDLSNAWTSIEQQYLNQVELSYTICDGLGLNRIYKEIFELLKLSDD